MHAKPCGDSAANRQRPADGDPLAHPGYAMGGMWSARFRVVAAGSGRLAVVEDLDLDRFGVVGNRHRGLRGGGMT